MVDYLLFNGRMREVFRMSIDENGVINSCDGRTCSCELTFSHCSHPGSSFAFCGEGMFPNVPPWESDGPHPPVLQLVIVIMSKCSDAPAEPLVVTSGVCALTPCGICSATVGDDGVGCDRCDGWFHS